MWSVDVPPSGSSSVSPCQRQDRRGPSAEKSSFPVVKGFMENNQECELLSASVDLVQTQLLTYRLTLAWHHGACSFSGLAVPCWDGEEEPVLPLGRWKRRSLGCSFSPSVRGDFLKLTLRAEMSCGLWWLFRRFSEETAGERKPRSGWCPSGWWWLESVCLPAFSWEVEYRGEKRVLRR